MGEGDFAQVARVIPGPRSHYKWHKKPGMCIVVGNVRSDKNDVDMRWRDDEER